MKLLKLKKGNIEYSFTCLESRYDVEQYATLNEQVKSKQAVGFWFGFKSQTYRTNPVDYAVHEENTNKIGQILALKMNFSEKPTSIFDYCNSADKIIHEMHLAMYRYIDNGKMVRINTKGGYCDIDSFDEYSEVLPMNEQEMYNFLLSSKTEMDFKVNSHTVVLENDNYIPEDLINKFIGTTGLSKERIQVITSFKTKSILFKDKDFIKFFEDGMIEHNLTNIVFETTGQDATQVDKIKKVFEYLMVKHPMRVLSIYIKTYKSNKDIFTTKSHNIKITYL